MPRFPNINAPPWSQRMVGLAPGPTPSKTSTWISHWPTVLNVCVVLAFKVGVSACCLSQRSELIVPRLCRRKLLLLECDREPRQIAGQRVEVDSVCGVDLGDPLGADHAVTMQRPGDGSGHAGNRVVVATVVRRS